LFQNCTKCTVAEYSELGQTFSPTALLIMGDPSRSENGKKWQKFEFFGASFDARR
jgi:hypothetical protein